MYTAVVHSRALKRDIRIVVCPVENAEPLLYFSTDTKYEVKKDHRFPHTRFQIEYGIRDAKQFTGLQSPTKADPRQGAACVQSFLHSPQCLQRGHKEGYPDLPVAQFKWLMFESYLANNLLFIYYIKNPDFGTLKKFKKVKRLSQD